MNFDSSEVSNDESNQLFSLDVEASQTILTMRFESNAIVKARWKECLERQFDVARMPRRVLAFRL